MRRVRFNSRKTASSLEALGYDVQRRDVVYGRRDDGATYQVWIDKGGILRLTVTRPARPPASVQHQMDGREYAVLREEQAQITVRVQLASPEELAEVLQRAERMAADAATPEPASQGHPHRVSEDEEGEHGIHQR